MSLIGRLEDLAVTDIIEIVFLSRRTGLLDVVDSAGRHTVLFWQGLMINASAPDHPDLATYLRKKGLVPSEAMTVIREMEAGGVPAGTAAMELNLVSRDVLANAIRERIQSVVRPLLRSREGQFNFLLIDSMSGMDIEYEPDLVLNDGDFAPNKIVATPDGEKLKPLRALEESMKAGKALLSSAPPPPPLPIDAPRSGSASDAGAGPLPPEVPALTSDFSVAEVPLEAETVASSIRNVVICEHNPLIRVAAKRAFRNRNVNVAQFASPDDAHDVINDLFRSNSLFVTFLELTPDGVAHRLLEQIKTRNPRLPVVMVDDQTDLRRRHDVLRSGANFYLTKPSPERLQPALAAEELALFADELVLFAERAFEEWEHLTGSVSEDAAKHVYELADKENLNRSLSRLKQLINELSSPNDVTQVAATIVRLATQYMDRAAVFVVTREGFAGVCAFGVTSGGEDMTSRVGKLRIARNEQSFLSDVADSHNGHRGKIGRTAANMRIIEAMGTIRPTEIVVLPIVHNEELVGVLYGDNAGHQAAIDPPSGLEIFLSQAGSALRNALLASTTPSVSAAV